VTGGTTPLDYAAWRESTVGRITERLERAVVLDLAGPHRGIDVLDVGAGDGAYALPLAKDGARVSALDRSLPALGVLDRRARDAGSPLFLVAADAQALPFEWGTTSREGPGSSPAGCGERSFTLPSGSPPLHSRLSIPSWGGRPRWARRSSLWKRRSRCRRAVDTLRDYSIE
jgi:SAM-dependent methyltransferase